jgi:hypothetical protein
MYERSREMHGAVYDWHTLEGPSVVRRLGRYWMTYSGGAWTGEGYAVAWAVAESPLGPGAPRRSRPRRSCRPPVICSDPGTTRSPWIRTARTSSSSTRGTRRGRGGRCTGAASSSRRTDPAWPVLSAGRPPMIARLADHARAPCYLARPLSCRKPSLACGAHGTHDLLARPTRCDVLSRCPTKR